MKKGSPGRKKSGEETESEDQFLLGDRCKSGERTIIEESHNRNLNSRKRISGGIITLTAIKTSQLSAE
ncbi:hypothetical protein CEXT_606151 [Caerostris extrusa]|uniref:Uncharacterized protein n=1 Tax=Caerostris extrusa TaxID=172846 RepID=A0AAV4SGC8_CAEEX|nr:hypothetical protein CEXT_606151 [Caerostris extrusa]